jgi:hypothetical protein
MGGGTRSLKCILTPAAKVDDGFAHDLASSIARNSPGADPFAVCRKPGDYRADPHPRQIIMTRESTHGEHGPNLERIELPKPRTSSPLK